MEIDLKQLRDLMRALKQFDLEELEIEKGDEKIRLRRGGPAGAAGIPMMHMGSYAPPPSLVPPAAASSPGTTAAVVVDDANIVYVTSPFVGTFYRAPSPNSAPFVDVGTQVKPGQVLCIVEAMKLMNEIEAELGGTIVEVLVESGKPVEYGDKLFRVRKA